MNKNLTIQLRVSAVEKQQIQQQAKRAGLTVSAWLRRLALVAAVLVLTACGRSPLTPTSAPVVAGPLRLALVGQSNARLARPAFAQQTNLLTLVPTSPGANAPGIEYWAAGTNTWTALAADLHGQTMDAFVFWQGEGDMTNPRYGADLADFIRRLRATVGHPNLLIVLMQYGRAYSGFAGVGSESASIAFVKGDAHALYVLTHDLEWLPDGGHMPDAGYAAVAQRIVTMVKAKKGML